MEYSNPIISKFNADGSITKMPVREYQVNPLNLTIQLEQAPSEYHRVLIDNMVEVYDIEDIKENNFKVNYNGSSVIYFHPSKANQFVTVREYYGIGVELITAKRVATEISPEGDIVKTLQDDVDNIRGKVQEYDAIYESYTTDTTNRVNTTINNKIAEVDTEMEGHRTTVNQLKTDYDNATHFTLVTSETGYFTALADNTVSFQLPVGMYNPLIDILFLDYQGVALRKDENYAITGGEVTLLGWTLKKDEKIYIKVEKGIKTIIPPGTDGGLVMNKSITEPKLSEDVANKLNRKLITNEYKFTATQDNTITFMINGTYYNPLQDDIELYYKGSRLYKDINYTQNGLEVTIFPINTGEIITYRIIKSVTPQLPLQSDGTQLQNETVGLIKLTTDVQDKVNKVTTLETQLATKANNIETENRFNTINTQLADIVINVTKPPIPIVNIKGDGTDETTTLLNLINYVADNHYTLLIPKSVQITIDIMNITGKSNFGIICEGTIKRKDNSTTGTLLRFINCSDISMPLIRYDGNGANNGCIENVAYTANQEHKHCMVFEGCTNVKGEIVEAINSCGDVLYISKSSKNIKFAKVTGKADTQIGRNIVSVISGQDIYIDHIYGDNFGHYDMPGGFDVEPNASTETVKNVFVKTINLTGGGSAPLALLASNSAKSENIFIGDVVLNRTLAYTNLAESESVFITASNVNIGKIIVKNTSAYNVNFVRIDNHGIVPSNINIDDSYGEGCYKGIILGQFGLNVDKINMKATLRNTKHDGVYMLACTNSKFNIDIDSVGATRAKITKSGDFVCDNIYITGDISNRGTGVAAMLSSSNPTSITNWTLENLIFNGWANDKKLYGAGLGGTIRKINCKNLTHQSSRPSFDRWNKGDIVYNTNPTELGTSGSKYIVEKWICIADGQGSASNFLEGRILTGN